jgi:hypothetical protein
LHATNIYTNHPAYPGGPFAYLPLFLYVESAMYWIANTAHLSFIVLGKLPMLVADTAIALVIYRTVLQRGTSPRTAALVAGLFYVNPLVLYNSAFYGRFDSLACLLLLVSTVDPRPRERQAMWYGLAIATKTFPVFTAASFFAATPRGRRRTGFIVAALAVLVVCLPYLRSPGAILRDVVLYDSTKTPQGLSWWTLLPVATPASAARWAAIGFVALAIGALAIAFRVAATDLDRAIATTLVLFLATNKVVLEQYLVWPMPWLALMCASSDRLRARTSIAMSAALTCVGLLDNESFHPFGRSCPALCARLAGCTLAYAVLQCSRGQVVEP